MKTNTNNIIITTKIRLAAVLLAIAAIALLPAIASAHGGEEHVTGTVTSVTATQVVVKTTAGKSVTVLFDAKTTFARADKPIQKSEIKAGDRVVIHAVEVDEKLTAHTVAIGAASAGKKEVATH